MREVPLTNGGVAIVDDADHELVAGSRWMAARSRYTTYAVSLSYPVVQMHRVILGIPRGDDRVVHHRNGDGLDNRRSNLRVFNNGVEHTRWHRARRKDSSDQEEP